MLVFAGLGQSSCRRNESESARNKDRHQLRPRSRTGHFNLPGSPAYEQVVRYIQNPLEIVSGSTDPCFKPNGSSAPMWSRNGGDWVCTTSSVYAGVSSMRTSMVQPKLAVLKLKTGVKPSAFTAQSNHSVVCRAGAIRLYNLIDNIKSHFIF
jgi:hypothetical protein